jgi:hypothetical protein
MRLLPLYCVHAVGTTGRDARARRRHVHDSRCTQCGACVVDDPVAAHVVAHPCACCCGATLALVTTCRACNASSTRAHPRHRGFWLARGNGVTRVRRVKGLLLPCAVLDVAADDDPLPPP